MTNQRAFIKKTVLVLLIALMAMPVFVELDTSRNTAQAATIYVVTASSGLRLRSGASSSSSVITTMKKGTEVKKSGSKNGWWLVRTKSGRVGYCDKNYLKTKGSTSTPSVTTGKLYYVNSVKRINVRSSASASSKLKGKLRGGTVVKLLSTKGSWGYIQVYNNGNKGYVKLSLLKKYSS